MKSSSRTRSRWILISLVPVAIGILSLFHYPSSYSLYPSSLLLGVSVFSVTPLATLEWYFAYSGRVRMKKLLLLFSIGVAGTIGSAFNISELAASEPCAEGVSGGGFPLPWYLTFTFYMGRGPQPLCPLLIYRPWGLFAVFSFLFDTIFYAAFAIAGNEIYRWTRLEQRAS